MKQTNITVCTLTALATLAAVISSRSAAQPTTAPVERTDRVPLQFDGGHETVGVDRGRPVVLIAAALGVPADVFREAFSHVHPAQGGRGPTEAEARANKAALLGALAKYGVTNDRLDEVSNYYRYRRENGELWAHRDAAGFATIAADGHVADVVLSDCGAGYTSPPTVTVPGHPETPLVAMLGFSKDLKTNGQIVAVPSADATTKPATQPHGR